MKGVTDSICNEGKCTCPDGYTLTQNQCLPDTGNDQNERQGNRRDMRKIHVIRKNKKNPFLDKVNGSIGAKFQVCIVFRWPGDVTHLHTYTNKHIYK